MSSAFLDWCAANGVLIDGVAEHVFPGGLRGVIATQSLQPGHVVVRAPRRVLLSTESARLDPALTRAVSAGAALSDRQLLALHLLHEASRGSQSAWWPYLATLPSHYAVLAAFSAEAAAQLQAEHACNAAERVREAAAAEWRGAGAALLALALPLKFRGLRAWQWAAGCIATRTMHVPFDDVGCLTPFGDLHNFQPPPPPTPPPLPGDAAYSAAANDAARPWPRRGVSSCRVAVRRKPSTCGGAAAVHRTQARCTPGNGCDRLEASDEGVTGDGALQGDEYCVCTRVAVAAGEQVFLCYGRYSNLELLEHYGFLFNRNAHDRVHLAPDRFPPEARLIQSDAWLHTDGQPSWALLKALRLHFADRARPARCVSAAERKESASLVARGLPCSAAVDRLALQAIADACYAALVAFPTSTRDDETQLLDVGTGAAGKALGDACVQLALRWRIQHKRALANGYKRAAAGLEALAEWV